MSNLKNILEKLSTARTEYRAEHSVVGKFVVPRFVEKLDLRKLAHSIALTGSRGSGKTTYLKYFSHATRFDKKLSNIEESELEVILLYWKPDISYCSGLNPNWLGSDSVNFFVNHCGLEILKEFHSAVENIIHHFPDMASMLESGNRVYSALSKITGVNQIKFDDLDQWISDQRYDLATRLNTLNTDGMLSIAPNAMLTYLLEGLRKDIPLLENSTFKVFVDEFENLLPEQQIVINNYRKTSSIKLNWNVAYKTKAQPSQMTSKETEHLQAPADYRELSLDQKIEEEFECYAAEIFLLKLQNAGISSNYDLISPMKLGDVNYLGERKSKEYRSKVLSIANKILPKIDASALCTMALDKKVVLSKVREALNNLEGLNDDDRTKIYAKPDVAITVLGTHKQVGFSIRDLKLYLGNDQKGRKPFSDKINTYRYNSLLSLNQQFAYINLPVYAGFDRFITMTKPNIRHFMELCYNSIIQFDDAGSEFGKMTTVEDFPSIDFNSMHLGAIEASRSLVKEVFNYPPHGVALNRLVERVGGLFGISQKSSYQSEPERTIFSIENSFGGTPDAIQKVIDSAVTWRVLIEYDPTRIRNDETSASTEYQFNPIYACRFGYSYRKKRGVSFTVKDMETIIEGSLDRYSELQNRFLRKWKVEMNEPQQGIQFD